MAHVLFFSLSDTPLFDPRLAPPPPIVRRPPWDDPERIRKVIKNGEDLFERASETLTHIKGCMHAPRSVSEADDHPYCRYENF